MKGNKSWLIKSNLVSSARCNYVPNILNYNVWKVMAKFTC